MVLIYIDFDITMVSIEQYNRIKKKRRIKRLIGKLAKNDKIKMNRPVEIIDTRKNVIQPKGNNMNKLAAYYNKLYNIIEESMHPVYVWPDYYKTMLYKHLNYQNRFIFCEFLYQNGLNPYAFIAVLRIHDKLFNYDKQAADHIDSLFTEFYSKPIPFMKEHSRYKVHDLLSHTDEELCDNRTQEYATLSRFKNMKVFNWNNMALEDKTYINNLLK